MANFFLKKCLRTFHTINKQNKTHEKNHNAEKIPNHVFVGRVSREYIAILRILKDLSMTWNNKK